MVGNNNGVVLVEGTKDWGFCKDAGGGEIWESELPEPMGCA